MQRVQGGRLEADNRHFAMPDEFFQQVFAIVFLAVFECGEGAYAEDVAILSHYGGGVFDVFHGGSVHHGAVLKFQSPALFVHVHHNDVHAQVEGGFLGAEAGAQAGVEKNKPQCFV